MRAAVYSRYGPPEVVDIQEVPKPIPGVRDVLIRVRATTVCAADWRLRKADPFIARIFSGLIRPKKTRILGMEFSGTVEAVGAAVTLFRPGDEVFGGTLFRFGAHAEYVCMPESGLLATKPANQTLEDAAAFFFGGMTVLSFLDKAKISPGDRVLVYGASGSVGVFAVQIAKYYGAHVTGVCSTANVELVRSLGADEVIDYTKEDFSRAGGVYDMVFETVGKAGWGRCLRSLKRGGRYVVVAGVGRKWFISNMVVGWLVGLWTSAAGTAKFISMPTKNGNERLKLLKDLIETGKLRTVIDRCYPLDQIREAHRHAEAGHKKGHALVLVERV